MSNQKSHRRKRTDWRRVIVNIMMGLLAAILLWVVVLWVALQTE